MKILTLLYHLGIVPRKVLVATHPKGHIFIPYGCKNDTNNEQMFTIANFVFIWTILHCVDGFVPMKVGSMRISAYRRVDDGFSANQMATTEEKGHIVENRSSGLQKCFRQSLDAKNVEEALHHSAEMLEANITCSPVLMTSFLTLIQETSCTEKAMIVFEAFIERGLVDPNIQHFSPLIRGSSSSDQAFDLLDRMKALGLEPNVFSYTSAISSCETNADWQGAMRFLSSMRSSGNHKPNEVTFSCLISVAASANKSHVIYGLIEEMRREGLQDNLICFSKALSACSRARLFGDVKRLLSDMEMSGLDPDPGVFGGILAGYRYLARTKGEDKNKLRVATLSLVEQWAGHPAMDEGVFQSVMDLLDMMGCHTDIMTVYRCVVEQKHVSKNTLRCAFGALTHLRDIDGAIYLLDSAKESGLATCRMYNSTMLLADTLGQHDVAIKILLSLLVGEEGQTSGKGRRPRPPQRFIRSRIISNALTSLTADLSTTFVEIGKGRLAPSDDASALYDSLATVLPLEVCTSGRNNVLLRPNAYPMACKILLDAKDYGSLRILLEQTLSLPSVNSTKLYEFGVKGLTLAFPLREGVRTILKLIGDCVDAGQVTLGADMLTLAMNRIFNVPSLPRSSIDRKFLDPDYAGRGVPMRYQRQKPAANTRSPRNDVMHAKSLDGIRSDTRERLLILMHTRARDILGPENMPDKSYRLASLACQNAYLFEKALDVYRDAQTDGRLDTFTSNVAISTLSRSRDYWDTALDLFNDCQEQDRYGYIAALVACETGGDWEHALFLLKQAKAEGVDWTASMVTTAIAACGCRGRADEALRLLEQAAANGVPLNAIAFNAAIFACVAHHAGEPRWKEAEDLVLFMQEHKVWPNRITYNALIEALGEAGEIERMDGWYLDAVTAGVLSPFKELARHGWVDLHLHSVHMAEAAVRMTFHTLRALYMQDALPNGGEIVFIVGKGRKLLQAINKQLADSHEFSPPIRCHVRSSNLGRLLLNKDDVINFLKQTNME